MGVLRIKEIMKAKGVSRDELAEMVGVSRTTISNISTETNLPTIKLLLEIAQKLDVDVRDLFIPTKPDKVEMAIQKIEEGLTLLR